MLEVLIPHGIGVPTGPKLVEDIKRLGVDVFGRVTDTRDTAPRPVTARVCWGISSDDGSIPELNHRQGTYNKLSAIRRFRERDIPTVRTFREPPSDTSVYPLLYRAFHHAEGRDIKLIETPRAAERCDDGFFTQVIPNDTEYRIWIFHRYTLGCYLREKYWPVQREGFGRNWWSGWGFTILSRDDSNYPRQACEYAKDAVAALGLDFGGVDIIKGNDNRLYVLEVNSAPGANGYCLRARNTLAEHIKEWYEGL